MNSKDKSRSPSRSSQKHSQKSHSRQRSRSRERARHSKRRRKYSTSSSLSSSSSAIGHLLKSNKERKQVRQNTITLDGTFALTSDASKKIDELVAKRVSDELQRRQLDIEAEIEKRLGAARLEIQQTLESKYHDQIALLETREVLTISQRFVICWCHSNETSLSIFVFLRCKRTFRARKRSSGKPFPAKRASRVVRDCSH